MLFAAALGLGPLGAQPAEAATNLVGNPGLEILDGPSQFPQCFEKSGWGNNDFSFTVTGDAHSGSRAVKIELTRRADGDRTTMMPDDSPWTAPFTASSKCVTFRSIRMSQIPATS